MVVSANSVHHHVASGEGRNLQVERLLVIAPGSVCEGALCEISPRKGPPRCGLTAWLD